MLEILLGRAFFAAFRDLLIASVLEEALAIVTSVNRSRSLRDFQQLFDLRLLSIIFLFLSTHLEGRLQPKRFRIEAFSHSSCL